MGRSFLSVRLNDPRFSGRGSPSRHRYSIGLLPASRLPPPRSGLERSDFVPWRVRRVPPSTAIWRIAPARRGPRTESVRPKQTSTDAPTDVYGCRKVDGEWVFISHLSVDVTE